MTLRRQRPSDSPLVQEIKHVVYEDHCREATTPDGCWDLVFMRRGGSLLVLQTGLITRPVQLEFGPGDEFLTVSFKPGVFMPSRPGSQTVDQGVVHPGNSKTSFRLNTEQLE